MKRVLLLLIAVGAFVGSLWAGWAFRSNNSISLDLDLIWVRVPNVELWWLLVLTMGLGALISATIMSFFWLRARLVSRRFRKRIIKLEAEVHELRSLPLVGSEPSGESLDAKGTASTEPIAASGKKG